MNEKVIGVDIGGSHISAAVVDLLHRSIVEDSLVRKHINSKESAEQILNSWAEVIEQLFSKYPFISKKIGIAMPGPFDYEKGICLIKGVDKYESLFNVNVKNSLAQRLKLAEESIVFMNDARCFLEGERFGGAAAGCDNVLGITLGTGLGSARFHSGQTFEGDLYFAPFKDGVAEDYISSRWFLKKYKEITGRVAKNVKELSEKISQEPEIKILFDEFGRNLGEVLFSYAQKFSYETLVIGGNIANAWELFFAETKTILDKLPAVTIKKAALGEDSALIGAASLWNDQKLE
jgi:glucokinase